MFEFVNKFFEHKSLADFESVVLEINVLEPEIKGLSDEGLQNRKLKAKREAQSGRRGKFKSFRALLPWRAKPRGVHSANVIRRAV